MGEASKERTGRIDVDLVLAQFETLDRDTHREALEEAVRARDVYRRLTDELAEKVAKLEQGLVGPKSQRFKGTDDPQLSLMVLAELLGRTEPASASDATQLTEEFLEQAETEAEAEADLASDSGGGGGDDDDPGQVHRRKRKPTGRKAKRGEVVGRLSMELLPEEVQRLGLDAFERIGEESSTSIERRITGLFEVKIIRPKFRAKTVEAIEAVREARGESAAESESTADVAAPVSWITTAAPPERPLPGVRAGPSLLANVATRRFDDHLPYNRLENVYEREGMRLGRSTLYGWMDALRELFAPLVAAMLIDARSAPYLCADATGVLVQAPEKCDRGHFWVLVAPGRHVLFAFSRKHDSAAVDELLGGYEGHLVLDAHSVYDHLFVDDRASEVGCWSHARKYFFKVLGSEPEIAKEFLGNLRLLFLLERKFSGKPRKQREQMRKSKGANLVDRHFDLCRRHEPKALDETPLAAAIRYSLNQENALRRFLGDGRLPMTNNISERMLRRQAVGRKNWLFVGSDDGAAVNATFTTLIASAHMHDLDPEAYLREVMCILPDWPKRRLLELAPSHWHETRQKPEAQELLETNLWLRALDEVDRFHAREL